MTINPTSELFQTHRQGYVLNASAESISRALDFTPNERGDCWKSVSQWRFTADGAPCCIWDYRGSEKEGRYSYFGPKETMQAIFGAENVL